MTSEQEIKPLVSPWVPTTNVLDLKILGKALEEGGEYVSALARCLIQGIESSEPTTGKPNHQWLSEEVADVMASMGHVIERFGLDEELINKRSLKKYAQLKTWHEME